MSHKVYQSLKAVYRLAYVRVGSRIQEVKFMGGTRTPKQINGKLVTGDPDLQAALESSPEYGKSWIRISPPDVPKPKVEEPVVELPQNTVQPKQTPPIVSPPVVEEEAPPEDIQPLVSISGVVNAQQAKNYILSNHGDTYKFKQLMSKEQIAEAARVLHIVFPDWQYITV